jgi:predicted tellurium resistance membrane protein TerC
MEINPYQSPAYDQSESTVSAENAIGCRRQLLRIVAMGCWSVSAVWATLGALASASERGLRDIREAPYHLVAVIVGVFILPSISGIFAGLAVWHRSIRFAACALLLFFSAIALIIVAEHVHFSTGGHQPR